ncbi:hypothetical protein ACQ4PT_017377 [Festuca glaucescens]
MASSTSCSRKLRVLLIPFFATSHIEPFTKIAIRLAAATPDGAVEATVAVTPANVPIVQSLLEGRRQGGHVKIATYPFPAVDGLPEGVENPGKAATPAHSRRIDAAALSEPLMRPVQEALIRAQSPDAIITDMHFGWNAGIADELGAPCIAFSAIGAFSSLAIRHVVDAVAEDVDVVDVPRFPVPRIRIPRTELPEFLRSQHYSISNKFHSLQAACFGLAVNTSSDLERPYCEMYEREGYVKRA